MRGSAVGLASSASRIGAAAGTYLVLEALTHLGIGPTMIVGAAITLVGALVSVAWAPETRGLTMGESAALPDNTGTALRPARRRPLGTDRLTASPIYDAHPHSLFSEEDRRCPPTRC